MRSTLQQMSKPSPNTNRERYSELILLRRRIISRMHRKALQREAAEAFQETGPPREHNPLDRPLHECERRLQMIGNLFQTMGLSGDEEIVAIVRRCLRKHPIVAFYLRRTLGYHRIVF